MGDPIPISNEDVCLDEIANCDSDRELLRVIAAQLVIIRTGVKMMVEEMQEHGDG